MIQMEEKKETDGKENGHSWEDKEKRKGRTNSKHHFFLWYIMREKLLTRT